MSRGYNARRKAKRQRARAAAEPLLKEGVRASRRSVTLIPALAIASVLVATAVLGFGVGTGPSQKQIDQEVTTLLAEIPQHGPTLGAPNAPVTIQMFADLECPTVKRFVEAYLPSLVTDWVRTGAVKLEYRSLRTDTENEHTFFNQEEAALAAGEQGRMWNFALTFVRQQGEHFTEYATEPFLAGIASQVSKLNMKRWNRDRKDISLFEPIALGVHAAHAQGLYSTPSFNLTSRRHAGTVRGEVQASLEKDVQALNREALGEVAILKIR